MGIGKKFKREIKTSAGIAINPPTQIQNYEEILENFDLILIMSVNPGFAGQKFIPDVLPKIEQFANLLRCMHRNGSLPSERSSSLPATGSFHKKVKAP